MLKKILLLSILLLITASTCFAIDNMPFSYYRAGVAYDLTAVGKTAFAGKRKYDDVSHNITISNTLLFNIKTFDALYVGPKLDFLFLFYDDNEGTMGRIEASCYAELDRLYLSLGLSSSIFDSRDGHTEDYGLFAKFEFGVNFFFDQVYYEGFAINLSLAAYPIGWTTSGGDWETEYFTVPTLVNLGLTYYL